MPLGAREQREYEEGANQLTGAWADLSAFVDKGISRNAEIPTVVVLSEAKDLYVSLCKVQVLRSAQYDKFQDGDWSSWPVSPALPTVP